MSLRPHVLVLVLVLATCMFACGAGPRLEKTTLFNAGEGGYKLYRIPGIVVTTRDAARLLRGPQEHRERLGSDRHLDATQRRRRRHLGGAQKVAHLGPRVPKNSVALSEEGRREGDQTANNPVAIVDHDGTMHFLYCVEYARCFSMRSTDDGATWRPPVDITDAFDGFRPDTTGR